MQSKIFVTGGTGFVGSYLLRYLVAKGQQPIIALKRPQSPMYLVEEIRDKINWVEGDILDVPRLEEVMEGVTQVYHCAALISFQQKDKEKMMEINQKGTANVVNIALHHNVKKLVHVSSIAAIGKEKDNQWISEDTKWIDNETTSNYAKSKYAAEMEVWRGIAEGLNATIINPSLIIGSGFWDRGTGEIFRLYGNGFAYYSNGVGGIVDVRDVAKYAILLMESEVKEERFIVSADNMPYKQLFNQIAQAAKKRTPYIQTTNWMNQLGWRLEKVRSIFTRRKPTITKESIRSANNQSYYNNRKSIEAFDFSYTPIEQTIQETTKQFVASDGRPAVLPLN